MRAFGADEVTVGTVQPYPLTIDIGYPSPQARWSVLARLPLALAVLVFSILLNVGATLAIWAAVIASWRIPSWLFAFQVNLGGWHTRSAAYMLLLTDDHPVFKGDYPITYEPREPATPSCRKWTSGSSSSLSRSLSPPSYRWSV